MSFIKELKDKILKGYEINRDEAIRLATAPLKELCESANEIREKLCGNSFDLCTIVNGKSGRCSEDCKFCAQSIHYKVKIEQYPILCSDKILKEAIYNEQHGILRYSIVTSGRKLSDDEFEKVYESYKLLRGKSRISLCASHGLLSFEQFKKLKEVGVLRYHNNLESSRRYFKEICTTHSYDEKINAIKNAQKAGLEVCSGGIMGMGETMDHRIDMFLELRELGIKSIPINILNPIKGTPFENLEVLKKEEICRIVSICRFIVPSAAIRLAGGRGLMDDKGKDAIKSGANAAISGDMLTTAGISIEEDMKMIKSLNFEVKRI